MQVFLLGEKFNAFEGKEKGLVNVITKPEQSHSEALMTANRLAEKPSHAIQNIKRLVNGWNDEFIIADTQKR